MKKSEALKMAILAMMDSYSPETMFEPLQILYKEYEYALYLEKEELKKQEKENG